MTGPVPLVELTRRDRASGTEHAESVHTGHLVVADEHGVTDWLGDADAVVFPRSSVKPFQALACLELVDRSTVAALDQQDLAICWSSHSGEPMHVAAVAGLLARSSSTPDDLTCPPDAPMDDPGGERHRILHNCSGKHAMFALAGAAIGVTGADLLNPDGPLQRHVLERLAQRLGGPHAIAVDGCGAPAVAVKLSALARAYAGLLDDQAFAPLLAAGIALPELVSGSGRAGAAVLGTGIMAKSGAEGVYAAAWRDSDGQQRALALKIADGAPRAASAALVFALEHAGALPAGTWVPPRPQGGGRDAGTVRPASELAHLTF